MGILNYKKPKTLDPTKRSAWKFYFGIGFGYDKFTIGGVNKGGTMMFHFKEWTILCFKFAKCSIDR